MRRDWELCRNILLLAESAPGDLWRNGPDRLDRLNRKQDAVDYHIRILGEGAGQAGLIELVDLNPASNGLCEYRLTWRGQEVIEMIRDEDDWRFIRTRAESLGVGLSLDAIRIFSDELANAGCKHG